MTGRFKPRLPGKAVIAAGLVTPVLIVGREVLAGRACGDQGGTYDYSSSSCLLDEFTAKGGAGPLVWVGVLLAVKLSALALVCWRAPRLLRPQSADPPA